MPAYFSYLPDIYVGTGANSDRQQEYTIVKNIFRRVKAREDLAKYTEFFEQVSIEDGERPDQIAEKFYGDAELDWVVLLTNNIIDVYTQWPKSRRELEYYTKEKYDVLDGIHHYETREIKWAARWNPKTYAYSELYEKYVNLHWKLDKDADDYDPKLTVKKFESSNKVKSG